MLRNVTLGFCTQALVFLLSIGYAGSAVTNRTIDDEFGDSVTQRKPIFLPTTGGIWAGQECGGCRVQPDRAVAFKGTWNAATFRPEEGGSGPISIYLSFKGTAIYVYFITGNQIAGGIITTLTECNFTLDGQHADFFQHIPDQSTDINYNVLAFRRTNLQNIDHTLIVSTAGVDYHVFVNFDYAIYTFDDGVESEVPSLPRSTTVDPPSPATHSSSTMTSETSSTTSRSLSTTSGNSSTGSVSSTTTAGNTTGNTITGNLTTIAGDHFTTSQSFLVAPTATSVPDNDRKVPLGAILGGTLGGLALALLAILFLCVYLKGEKQRKKLGLLSVVDPTAQNPTALQREGIRDPRTFSLHKRVSSRPRSTSGLPINYEAKAQHRVSNSHAPDMAQYMFTKGRSNFGNIETRRSSGSNNAPASSAATADDALRTRQIDFERQRQDAERGLRDIGIEPQRDSPGPSTFPTMLHTGVHIQHRSVHGEVEEPPPKYSAS